MTDPSPVRASAQRIAEQYFDMCRLEYMLDEKLMQAFGALPYGDEPDETDPDSWPCGHMVYDDYDGSFELWNIKGDWMPTSEQLEAAFALGFSRCWLVYPDGTERYCTPGKLGERHAVNYSRDSQQKYHIAKLKAEVSAAEARGRQQAEQIAAREIERAHQMAQKSATERQQAEQARDERYEDCKRELFYEGELRTAAENRVAALTQALKDIRANLVMAAQQPDGSIGGGMTAMGCHSLVDAIDAALTGAMK